MGFFLDESSVCYSNNLSDILTKFLSIKSKLFIDLNWELLKLHWHLLGLLISLPSCGMDSIEYVLLVTCVIFLMLGWQHHYSSLFQKCWRYDFMMCPETALSWRCTHTSIVAKGAIRSSLPPFQNTVVLKNYPLKSEKILCIRWISPSILST